jgi:hypothetical protein
VLTALGVPTYKYLAWHSVRDESPLPWTNMVSKRRFSPLLKGILSFSLSVVPSATFTGSKPEGVLASGTMAESSATVGTSVNFVAALKNQGSGSLQELRLVHVEPPEYEVNRVCWLENGKDHCEAVTGNKVQLIQNIGAYQALTIWGTFCVKKPHDKGKLTLIISWKDESGSLSDLGIPLGDFTSQNWYEYWGARFYGFIKDFAVPLVLLLMGFAYQSWDKKREQRRQDKDQERQQVLQTWNNMLPTSHRYATKHYMPVAAALNGVLDGLKEHQKASAAGNSGKADEWSKRAFYSMALLGKRLRHLGEAIGGFYFKDRVGEELASESLNSFRNHYYWSTAVTVQNFSLLVDHVDVNETIGIFQQKFTGMDPTIKPIFANAYADFRTWLGSPNYKESVDHLRAFLSVLEYEMNRPYEFWYDKKELLNLDSDTKMILAHTIAAVSSMPNRSTFKKLAEEYLKRAGAR